METQNNNVSQETESQAVAPAPVAQAQVAPQSVGNLFDAQAQQPIVHEVPVVAQANVQQPWNQQPQAVAPAPTLDQMWTVINTCIDGMQIRNFVTIRNKYSNGDLLAQNQPHQHQAKVIGFGLCMNKGSKKAMGVNTRQYNRIVCDLADAIAHSLGNWNGVDVNSTNASAIDCFDKSQVQRPPRPAPQYAQPQYAYSPAPQTQYAQPQQPYGYTQPPQYSYAPQQPQQGYYR